MQWIINRKGCLAWINRDAIRARNWVYEITIKWVGNIEIIINWNSKWKIQ